jgi:hypothetical protein
VNEILFGLYIGTGQDRMLLLVAFSKNADDDDDVFSFLHNNRIID